MKAWAENIIWVTIDIARLCCYMKMQSVFKLAALKHSCSGNEVSEHLKSDKRSLKYFVLSSLPDNIPDLTWFLAAPFSDRMFWWLRLSVQASVVTKSHRDHEESRSQGPPLPSRHQIFLAHTPLSSALRLHRVRGNLGGREDLNLTEYFMESSCCIV